MLKRVVSLFIVLNIIWVSFSAELFAQERTISEVDVDMLFAQLPDNLQTEKDSPIGITAAGLLIGGYLYLVADGYICEKQMLKKEDDIIKWMTHKMSDEEWYHFLNTHFSDIRKYIIYRSQPKETRLAFADKIIGLRCAKRGAVILLLIAAVIGVEYLLTSQDKNTCELLPLSSDRVEIKRILITTAREHPEAFALSAYLIPNRRLVCSIISEDEELYDLLKSQVEFALSKENKEFTYYLLKATQEGGEKRKEDLLKQDLKLDAQWFKNNWKSKYDLSNSLSDSLYWK